MGVFFMDLWDALLQTTPLERFSVVCSIIQVLLSRNNKVSNYFFGILGILSGMYVLFGAKLYAEIALNMYYLVMSVYGWWYWVTNKEAREQPITRCDCSLLGIESFYGLGCSRLGCLGFLDCMGRYVALGQTKDRELDIVEYQQCLCNSVAHP